MRAGMPTPEVRGKNPRALPRNAGRLGGGITN